MAQLTQRIAYGLAGFAWTAIYKGLARPQSNATVQAFSALPVAEPDLAPAVV